MLEESTWAVWIGKKGTNAKDSLLQVRVSVALLHHREPFSGCVWIHSYFLKARIVQDYPVIWILMPFGFHTHYFWILMPNMTLSNKYEHFAQLFLTIWNIYKKGNLQTFYQMVNFSQCIMGIFMLIVNLEQGSTTFASKKVMIKT